MTMTKDLVSIVICAYNNWPDLELAIQSTLCQSYQSLEVIVVDNSSTDDTQREVHERFGGRVQYIRQENRGDSGAYNTGMRAARGEFVHFMDGDDVFVANKIEKQLQVFAAHPDVDVVYGPVAYFRKAEDAAPYRDNLDGRPITLEDFLANDGTGVGPSLATLFRRSALERIGPYDESLYNADTDYILRALWIGCRFALCPVFPLGFYRLHANQMSANREAMMAGAEAIWVKALTYIDREPYRSSVKANLARVQFLRAISRADGLTRRAALNMLGEARATSTKGVSLPAYLLGASSIVLAGNAATAPGFRAVRRTLARIAHFRLP
jgi:glycosyltransferase involved in cell wall biosynthesis